MAKLTIIIGMAGSGKSSLCVQIARKEGAKLFEDATLTNSEKRRAGHGCLGELVARLLGRGEHCVMDESHLTMRTFRDLFKSFCDQHLADVEQKWIFFEYDLVACINNVHHDFHNKGRQSFSRIEALYWQRQSYVVPDYGSYPGHFRVHPVYRQETPRFGDDQEAEAIDWLQGELQRLALKPSGIP